VVKREITDPLGMHETASIMTPEQRAASVPVHLRGEDGSWAPSDIDLNQEPEYFAGVHGSTPPRATTSGSSACCSTTDADA
jgi:CubicO group peptidase (beta-lactamase class C family)